MIVSREEMLAVERAAFHDGRTSAATLMEEVGRRMADLIRQLAPAQGSPLLVAYLGKGNNAGDALVAARHLRAAGWEVGLRLAGDRAMLGELAERKLAGIEENIPRWSQQELLDVLVRRRERGAGALIVLDGLLGVGANGPLREPIKEAAMEVNRLRREHGAQIFALDLPTGVDADGAAPDTNAVVADVTLTVGFAKQGLVTDRAVDYVGHLEVISLPALTNAAAAVLEKRERGRLTVHSNLTGLLPPRAFESNKTDYGRVGIIAGAIGTTGAAVMCALGALRAGAGLVTLLVGESIYPTAAVTAAPEVMVKPIASYLDVLDEKFDVLAVGPGLNPHEGGADLRTIIERWPRVMVVDAGAITALAEDPAILQRAAGPRLLTPHSGEMARLWKGEPHLGRTEMKDLPRAEIVTAFREAHLSTLLLKGARTLIGQRGQPLAYNSTGNAGMATGGMGDILTGVCAALLGQGLSPYDAARLGAFLCGRAAELASHDGGESEQSLLAADLPGFFGRVFTEIRRTPLHH